jgi:hypothetical protein
MAARKPEAPKKPRQVRKSVVVEADKLETARRVLGASSDAEVFRLALDQLLSHLEGHHEEE